MAQAHRQAPTVVKIKPKTHAALQEISRDENRPMGEIITDLVERYERERFWRTAAADLDRLRADASSWEGYLSESRELDRLANEGLAEEPPFFTPEEEDEIRAEIESKS